MTQVVRVRSSTYTVYRPTDGTSRFGESDTSLDSGRDVSMWLFEPEEINQDTEFGDRLGGDLQGLALPSADVQVHDELTHGAEDYEVERIMHHPDNDNKVLKAFALQKKVN